MHHRSTTGGGSGPALSSSLVQSVLPGPLSTEDLRVSGYSPAASPPEKRHLAGAAYLPPFYPPSGADSAASTMMSPSDAKNSPLSLDSPPSSSDGPPTSSVRSAAGPFLPACTVTNNCNDSRGRLMMSLASPYESIFREDQVQQTLDQVRDETSNSHCSSSQSASEIATTLQYPMQQSFDGGNALNESLSMQELQYPHSSSVNAPSFPSLSQCRASTHSNTYIPQTTLLGGFKTPSRFSQTFQSPSSALFFGDERNAQLALRHLLECFSSEAGEDCWGEGVPGGGASSTVGGGSIGCSTNAGNSITSNCSLTKHAVLEDSAAGVGTVPIGGVSQTSTSSPTNQNSYFLTLPSIQPSSQESLASNPRPNHDGACTAPAATAEHVEATEALLRNFINCINESGGTSSDSPVRPATTGPTEGVSGSATSTAVPNSCPVSASTSIITEQQAHSSHGYLPRGLTRPQVHFSSGPNGEGMYDEWVMPDARSHAARRGAWNALNRMQQQQQQHGCDYPENGGYFLEKIGLGPPGSMLSPGSRCATAATTPQYLDSPLPASRRIYSDDRDRMVYVSWIPKRARAYCATDKRKMELDLKRRLREEMGLVGLTKVLLFPPKGVHCKLIFESRAAAANFMSVYGGENRATETERWKFDICRILNVDMHDKFDTTVVKIEWSQK